MYEEVNEPRWRMLSIGKCAYILYVPADAHNRRVLHCHRCVLSKRCTICRSYPAHSVSFWLPSKAVSFIWALLITLHSLYETSSFNYDTGRKSAHRAQMDTKPPALLCCVPRATAFWQAIARPIIWLHLFSQSNRQIMCNVTRGTPPRMFHQLNVSHRITAVT